LASDNLVEIKECMDLQVNVAGIKMEVTAYVTGIGVTYDLLLSRRWMEGVGAQEDYEKRRFSIKNKNGQRIEVLPTEKEQLHRKSQTDHDPGPGTGANTQEELEEEWAEDAIQGVFRDLNIDVDDEWTGKA
jgi:hypothetical protein